MNYGRRKVSARLAKTRNGPVFNSPVRYRVGDAPAYEAQEVGTITAVFDPADRLTVKIELDEGQVPEGAEAVREHQYRRLAFGYPQHGTNTDPERAISDSSCWVDLRGRWVFVESLYSLERTQMYYFDFWALESTPALDTLRCEGQTMSHVLVYRDGRGNHMRCISAAADLAALGVAAAEHEKGRCVVRGPEGSGEPLLWFSISDAGLKQILAASGAPPEAMGQTVSLGVPGIMQGLRLR